MPPRIILGVEYAAHLYQSRRIDLGLLEAALAKWLAFDLVADTEFGLVLFSQQSAWTRHLKRLDSSTDSRLALFSPPIDPFEEPPRLYSELELAQLGITGGAEQQAKLVAGTCSLARFFAEAAAMLQQRSQYDDLGVDLVIVTSGLFTEDEAKVEELVRAHFRPASMRLHVVVYPSAMLLDTRSADGQEQLSGDQGRVVVKNRIAKLLLLERLTRAKVHLVKEHADAAGHVQMSTLLQFYQILQHISSGHSWDQTNSMVMLGQQQLVESAPVGGGGGAGQSNQTGAYKLQFKFSVDGSLGSELVVGFFDPRQSQHQQQASGKRFALRNLQLRSPNGQLVFTDSQHWPQAAPEQSNGDEPAELTPGEQASNYLAQADDHDRGRPAESALFEYRTQLGLAGFHLRASHLPGNASAPSARRAGLWTLSAHSDEHVQTGAVAMARVNPGGDTVTARCWIQSYHNNDQQQAGELSGEAKIVKVFVQLMGDAHSGPVQDVQSRLEVEDELGNIVQNVQMLDDGLGSPDITRGDGILSQLVQRASRAGFYRVSVEVSANQTNRRQQNGQQRSKSQPPVGGEQSASGKTWAPTGGQDNACCGSQMPSSPTVDTRHLSRHLYCGTFYLDAESRLDRQRPPRVSNLTVTHVDQDTRRVTIRWFEPAIDIEFASNLDAAGTYPQTINLDSEHSAGRHFVGTNEQAPDPGLPTADQRAFNPSGKGRPSVMQHKRPVELQEMQASHYEIKLFTDRDAAKRAFDAKPEVGFKFSEWTVEGNFPSPSPFGGQKEATLKIPHAREGIYHVAVKVYNNRGAASAVSSIVQFWMRANLTRLNDTGSRSGASPFDASLLGQAVSVDDEGNMYDSNGELVHQSLGPVFAASQLEGVSLLLALVALAFLLALGCIWLFACLARSVRKSLRSRVKSGSGSSDKPAIIVAGTGSSLASSQCASSELHSSGSFRSDAELEVSHKLRPASRQEYQMDGAKCYPYQDKQSMLANWQPQPHHQNQQAVEFCPQAHQQQQLQHTLVNGYPYATIGQAQLGHQGQVQSWTADVLLSHYDKVKQARERNEAPPVMRVETVEAQSQLEGLPRLNESALDGQRARIHQMSASNYMNQQLQQQLTSVLKGKRDQFESEEQSSQQSFPGGYYNSPQTFFGQRNSLEQPAHSSPALDGLTDTTFEHDHQLTSSKMDQLIIPQALQLAFAPSQGLFNCENRPAMHTESSIYSQLTNLHQVNSNCSTNGANRYQASQQWQPIYSERAPGEVHPRNNQVAQIDIVKPAISEV